jgi:hypothetical protein
MHTRINAGSSDTDVNEFAVKPRGVPSGWIVVTTVTPVTNAPNARRNSMTSKEESVMVLLLRTDGLHRE